MTQKSMQEKESLSTRQASKFSSTTARVSVTNGGGSVRGHHERFDSCLRWGESISSWRGPESFAQEMAARQQLRIAIRYMTGNRRRRQAMVAIF